MIEINSIHNRLSDLEKEFEKRKKEITQSVEKDLLSAIEAKKAELKKLEDEFAKLVGKAPKAAKDRGKRRRITREELAQAKKAILELLRSKPQGVRMKELVAVSGASPVAIRRILSAESGVTSQGARATMIYQMA